MDNNVFFKGKAIIDEQFNILSVDDELKDFLGDNLVNTKIARLIHPSDINQLETAVKNVQSESGFVTALRMVDNTGRYRWFVYIIDEAEKMTVQAQNALLKTIEEPPEYAVIMLLTSNVDALLPTIQSRCVRLDLKVVDDSLVKKYLMERLHVPDYQAEIDASFAQGSIGRAKEAATSEEFSRMTEKALKILKYVNTMEVYELSDEIKALSDEKQNISDYLDIFQFWFRDVLMFKATREIDNLVFKQEINYIKEQASQRSYENLEKILEALEKTKVRLRANVNFELALELLFLTIRER